MSYHFLCKRGICPAWTEQFLGFFLICTGSILSACGPQLQRPVATPHTVDSYLFLSHPTQSSSTVGFRTPRPTRPFSSSSSWRVVVRCPGCHWTVVSRQVCYPLFYLRSDRQMAPVTNTKHELKDKELYHVEVS